MEYREFIDRVRKLEFIDDEQTADSAVKSVLGIFASRMQETQAHDLVSKLPRQLDMETLRGHQNSPTNLSVGEYAGVISQQFNLSLDQSRDLINTVWQIARESVGTQRFTELSKNVPGDWAEAIRNVQIPRIDPRSTTRGRND